MTMNGMVGNGDVAFLRLSVKGCKDSGNDEKSGSQSKSPIKSRRRIRGTAFRLSKTKFSFHAIPVKVAIFQRNAKSSNPLESQFATASEVDTSYQSFVSGFCFIQLTLKGVNAKGTKRHSRVTSVVDANFESSAEDRIGRQVV